MSCMCIGWRKKNDNDRWRTRNYCWRNEKCDLLMAREAVSLPGGKYKLEDGILWVKE